ncbi:MAG TPA: YbhB/YbcL family Raf kinase inhibitor-like protein [Pseudolysinimonas sp.]|nr:YbhB/YbcL family Raf kinase inhibitor-like protein [Pseudolysinimonas sp.]
MHPLEVLLTPLGRALRNRRAGEAASIAGDPQLATGTRFDVTSPSFADGQEIPAQHCGWLIGPNIAPALAWGPLPAGTVELVLLLEDLDGPSETPRVHTIASFPPPEGGLAEGALTPDAPGFRFAPRDGKPGRYVGPRPLPGHGTHRYRFHLYAVDAPIDVAALTDPRQLPGALAGHVLGSGTLIGTRAA